MAKINFGGKEFIPPPANSVEQTQTEIKSPLRKITKRELYILIGIVSLLVLSGWLPTYLTFKYKVSKLEQKIDQIDPLAKIQVDLNNKLDKLEKDLKVDDDDLYKILSKLRNERKLLILDQLEQIQLYKSLQKITTTDFYTNKLQELKQKELLYHR